MDAPQNPDLDAPTVAPTSAEPGQLAHDDQTQQASQPQPAPSEQPHEYTVPAKVNVEEAAEGPTARLASVNNGYSSDSKAHYHSRSIDFHHSAPEHAAHDTDHSARLNSSPSLSHHPQLLATSRPGSGLSNGPDLHPLQLQQPDPNQRQGSQSAKNSVVIKVGMVGDAQIGKTSLMVKYVEGSWDEDYIQTLGMYTPVSLIYCADGHACRCQLHGENDFHPQH